MPNLMMLEISFMNLKKIVLSSFCYVFYFMCASWFETSKIFVKLRFWIWFQNTFLLLYVLLFFNWKVTSKTWLHKCYCAFPKSEHRGFTVSSWFGGVLRFWYLSYLLCRPRNFMFYLKTRAVVLFKSR